jgi:hypothetical protein
MSRRQQILVCAVLGALALLYVTGVGIGAGAGTGGQADLHNGFVRWLGDRFGQPASVARHDLTADCLTGATLTVHGSCTLHVASAGQDVRRLRLHAQDAVTVTAKAPKREDTVRDDVAAGTDATVTVDSGGGDVVVACTGTTTTCVVTLP